MGRVDRLHVTFVVNGATADSCAVCFLPPYRRHAAVRLLTFAA